VEDDSLRSVIARCFAALATGGEDLDEHIEEARKIEHWILTGDYAPAGFARFGSVASACLTRAKLSLKSRKGGK
jgi:hypothetical protein